MQFPWPWPFTAHQPPPTPAPTYPCPQAPQHLPHMIPQVPATMPHFPQPTWPPTAHFPAQPPTLPPASHPPPTFPFPYTLPPTEPMSTSSSSPATAPPQPTPAPTTQPSNQPSPQPVTNIALHGTIDPLPPPTILFLAAHHLHAAVPEHPSHFYPTPIHFNRMALPTSQDPAILPFRLFEGSSILGDPHCTSCRNLRKSNWRFGWITMPINSTHPTNPNTLMSPACYSTVASPTKTFLTSANTPTSNGTIPPTVMTFSITTAFPSC